MGYNFVQGVTGGSFFGTASPTGGYSANCAAGSLLVAVVQAGAVDVRNVSSNTGGPDRLWKQAARTEFTSTSLSLSVWYLDNAPAGPTTVRVFLDTASTGFVSCFEYSGGSGYDLVDSIGWDASTNATSTPTTQDSCAAHGLVFSAIYSNGGLVTGPPTFLGHGQAGTTLAVASLADSGAAGTQGATWSGLGTTNSHIAITVVFKLTGDSPSGQRQVRLSQFSNTGGGSSAAFGITTAPLAGNSLVMAIMSKVAVGSAADNVTSVSDDQNNPWYKLVSKDDATNATHVALWWAPSVATVNPVITIQWSPTTTYYYTICAEYANLGVPAAMLDVTGTAAATVATTSFSVSTATATKAGDLALALFFSSSATASRYTKAAGWQERWESGSSDIVMEELQGTSNAIQTATVTSSASQVYDAVIVGFTNAPDAARTLPVPPGRLSPASLRPAPMLSAPSPSVLTALAAAVTVAAPAGDASVVAPLGPVIVGAPTALFTVAAPMGTTNTIVLGPTAMFTVTAPPGQILPFIIYPAPSPRPPETLNPYRFLAADVLTGAVLAELPLRNSSFESRLNDTGTWSGELLLTDPKVAQIDWQDVANQPGRIAIYVERHGTLVWGGFLWSTSYTASTHTLTLNGNDFWSYFLQQRPAFNNAGQGWTYTNVDLLFPVQDQLNYAQSFPNGNIGVIVPNNTAGQLTNVAIQNSQLITVGQFIQDMALGTALNSGSADRVVTDGITFANSPIVQSPTANFGSYFQDLGGPISGGSIPTGAKIGTIDSPTQIHLKGGVSSSSQDHVTLNIANPPIQRAGFDFAIDVSYDANNNFVKRFNLGYPRRGRVNSTNNLFIDLHDVIEYTWPMQSPANLIRAAGTGTGTSQLTSSQAAQPNGWPLLCATLSTSSALDQKTLDGRAEALLDALQNGPVLPTVTVRAADTDLPFGSYITGDSIRVYSSGDERFPGTLDSVQRLVAWVLHPGDDGMDTVDLTFNNMPTFV